MSTALGRWRATPAKRCLVAAVCAALMLGIVLSARRAGKYARPPADIHRAPARTAQPAAGPAMLQAAAEHSAIRLCQAYSPVLEGVDCSSCEQDGEPRWSDHRLIPWQAFAQGEYIGPHRLRHVPLYRLRVDDVLELVYRVTRDVSLLPYELNVGDELRIESLTDPTLDRNVVILSDGTITVRLSGQVRAEGRTIPELQQDLEERYTQYYKVPAITVTAIKTNTKLEDLRSAVDSRFGAGGQGRQARISPDGTIQLPGLARVPAQGLTVEELKEEISERYAQLVDGIEVTPVLLQRAPRFIYVVGEVPNSGRYQLEAPTTALQAISLAGGWNKGGNLRQIVVFRRTEDWRLIATKLDLRGALLGKRPCPADEIWLRDSDIVVVPKSPVQLANDFIEMVFTRGIYGVVPNQGFSFNFSKTSTL